MDGPPDLTGRPSGHGRGFIGMCAVLSVLAMGLFCPVSSARAGVSRPLQLLRAIVRHDGRSAIASRIVRPLGVATAVVDHATHVTVVRGFVSSSHSICDVYRFTHGNWHRVARIDFGKNSLGTNLDSPPRVVALTGATDFLITFEAAGNAPVSIVSDTGGRWRAVPFAAPGQPRQTAIIGGEVDGDQITSQTDDCRPDCAQGHRTSTTWTYNAPSRSFEPYIPPVGACTKQTLQSGDEQFIGCFAGPSQTGTYTTPQAFKVDGLTVAPQPGTTFSVTPSDPRGAITASGSGCLQALVTAVVPLGELDLKCWKGPTTVEFTDNQLVLTSLFASAPAANFFGLSFDYAAITLQPGYRAQIQGSIGLAPLFGNPLANANFTATADNQVGLAIGQLCFRINPGTFGWALMRFGSGDGVFPLRGAQVCYFPGLQELTGTATLGLPFGKRSLKGAISIHVGPLPAPGSVTLPDTNVNVSFAGFQVALQTINKPIYGPIYLQYIEGGVTLYPHLGFLAGAGVSLLPSVGVLGQQLTLLEAIGQGGISFGGDNGFSDFFFGSNPDNYLGDTSQHNGWVLNLDGKVYLLGTNYSALATLSSAHATIRSYGMSTFYGDINDDDLPLLPTLHAHVAGEVAGSHFTATGHGSWSEYGQSVASGNVIASDRGIGGCAQLGSFSSFVLSDVNPLLGAVSTIPVGFTANKPHGLNFFTGCSFGDLAPVSLPESRTRQSSVGRAPTTGGHTISVPSGRRAEEIAVHGATGPPAAVVTGPGNRTLQAPSQLNHLTAEKGAVVLADTAARTTYYIIGRPRGGRWKVEPSEGASPISRISVAGLLSRAAIRVRVSGSGASRRLGWRFAADRGRSVLFLDTGRNAYRLITDTTRDTGSVRFNPLSAGPSGRRQVIAIVEQDGVQRSRSPVARYTASPPPRLGPIRDLRVRRKGGHVRIGWRPVRGAQVYVLLVKVAGRGHAEYAVPARVTHETILSRLGGTVTVYAAGRGHRAGAAGRVRFR